MRCDARRATSSHVRCFKQTAGPFQRTPSRPPRGAQAYARHANAGHDPHHGDVARSIALNVDEDMSIAQVRSTAAGGGGRRRWPTEAADGDGRRRWPTAEVDGGGLASGSHAGANEGADGYRPAAIGDGVKARGCAAGCGKTPPSSSPGLVWGSPFPAPVLIWGSPRPPMSAPVPGLSTARTMGGPSSRRRSPIIRTTVALHDGCNP